MKIIKYPKKDEWSAILKRPEMNHAELFERVEEIIRKTADGGDAALRDFTKKFDGILLQDIQVLPEEIEAARDQIDQDLIYAIDEAYENIERFHKSQICKTQVIETTPGVRCWQKLVPIEKVGLYIPGGSAPLLSTALMLGIPARLAGCEEIIMCTPPGVDGKINPIILYIADLLKIDKIFKVGGAQAIAAMAYGTETIPAVNKIFGPGNQFVTAAKVLVSRDKVAIDMPAGPSEVAVVADKTSVPEFIASDLLSQAEHGTDSQVLLLTTDEKIIEEVNTEVEKQLSELPRKEIARESLSNSRLILLRDRDEMAGMINSYGPEHLIIACADHYEFAEKIKNAGSVFLGNFTPESAGDYASGTNHTLPTNGWAHAYSGVNMDSFVKKITFQEISKYGLLNISQTVMCMAEAEDLHAHRNAISIRINSDDELEY